MMKDDELWLKKIKDKLEDYSEPLPVAGWERLEKELSVSGAPITGPHRMIPFRRWAVAAAAVLLLGGFLFGGFTFRAALEAAKDGLLLIAALGMFVIAGMLMVKGTDLHVNRLSVEKGEVDLSGNIDSIAYSNTSQVNRSNDNFFAKLFR